MDWGLVFVEPVKMMLGKVAQFVPIFIGFLVILLIGWIIAVALKNVFVKLLVFLKLDVLSGRIGFSKMLEKAEIKYTLSEIIGVIFYWIIIFIIIATAINALGLTSVSVILDSIILYIPNIIVAIFVLILGMFLASFLNSLVVTATSNAGVLQAKVLGKVVSIAVIIFTVVIALKQLKIDIQIINSVITILFASSGLAFAIAFGLGSKDVAAKLINELYDFLKKK
ncbi:MAG: hypothetical protein PHE88_04080 [Elusimicrobia bacterium]|nr:hypothetical protein [Elusimicrobiota bacterium]